MSGKFPLPLLNEGLLDGDGNFPLQKVTFVNRLMLV